MSTSNEAPTAKLRCWAGCLAMVNSRQHKAENLRIVRVVRYINDPNDPIYGFDWQATGEPSWVIEPLRGSFNFPYTEPTQQVPCRDSSLIPLPPKIADRITSEVGVPGAVAS